MNISKFLLIDIALAVAVIPLLFLLQSKETSLSRISKKEEILKKTNYKIPDQKKLLELERNAKHKGSGIRYDSLLGDWKFASVGKKDTDEENSIFSSFLRIFSATLSLKKDISTENPLKLSISASIKFGLLSIQFSGIGYLKGEQPFLPFFFNLIEVKSGSTILLSKSLEEPVEIGKSFFALIAIGRSNEWLSARGQGGGLILLLKD